MRSGDHLDVAVTLTTVGVELSRCEFTHGITPDKPATTATIVALKPSRTQTVALIDGLHAFIATCPSGAGDLSSRTDIRVIDYRAEKCLGL